MSAITIAVYPATAYTKTGRLKKNARSEWASTHFDVEPLTVGAVERWIMECAEKLKREYRDFSSPYVFTHINALDSMGRPVYIVENVRMKDGEIMTSPTRLYGNLTGDARYSL